VICNEEDTDGRARVTTDEERVLPGTCYQPPSEVIMIRTSSLSSGLPGFHEEHAPK